MTPRQAAPRTGYRQKFYFSREPRSTRQGPQAAPGAAAGSACMTPPAPEAGSPKYGIDLADFLAHTYRQNLAATIDGVCFLEIEKGLAARRSRC
jgi:hypothetical protein